MKITREAVNQWLGTNNRGREWLANRCNTSLSNVGMWLNKKGDGRPIPPEHQITIRKLMDEDNAAALAAPPHTLVLEFNSKQYAPIEQAALQNHETVREWAKRTLNEATEADMKTVVEKRNGTHNKNSS